MNRKRKLNQINTNLKKKNKFIEEDHITNNLQNKLYLLNRINNSIVIENEILEIKKNYNEKIKLYTEKNNYLIDENNLLKLDIENIKKLDIEENKFLSEENELLKEQNEILSKKIFELEESLINKQFSKIKIKEEIPSYIN
jgi:hypothetical protein